MRELQREGRSVSSIVQEFLQEFNLQKDDVNYTVIDKGSRGFLSLWGSRPAVVKFFAPEEKDILKQFIEGLLDKMDLTVTDIQITYHNFFYQVNLKGVSNPGFLIGKEGRMLNSVQHLLNRLIENGDDERNRVLLNVDNYREKREDMIRNKVRSVIKKVQTRGKSVTIDQMTAADRKIVYRHLEKEPDLKTMTIGKGELKKIVVYPVTEELSPAKNSKKQN